MGKGIGSGPGRPPENDMKLSDNSLVAIAIFFLKRVSCKHEINPALEFLNGWSKVSSR
jgi:hypothetical protein